MKDFNSYSQESGKEKKEGAEDVADLARSMARAFNGKGEADILRAIYKEAENGRKAGTLTDADLDNFYAAVAPMLDAGKRKKLEAVLKKLKKY